MHPNLTLQPMSALTVQQRQNLTAVAHHWISRKLPPGAVAILILGCEGETQTTIAADEAVRDDLPARLRAIADGIEKRRIERN